MVDGTACGLQIPAHLHAQINVNEKYDVSVEAFQSPIFALSSPNGSLFPLVRRP